MRLRNDKAESAWRGTVVFDLDGVLYVGDSALPGAAETIAQLTASGWQLLFATNNSTKSPEGVAELLSMRADIPIEPRNVLTSGMAAASYLSRCNLKNALVLGSTELQTTIAAGGVTLTTNESDIDVVVVGLDRALTYTKIEVAARAVRRGAVFLATNLDPTIPTHLGEAPGAGTIAAAVATASGSDPVACGKPYQPMLDLVEERIESSNVWMVGDRPETDIAFAKRAGWGSILTLSGVTHDAAMIPKSLTPDHVLASVASLSHLLRDVGSRSVGDEG